MHHPETELDELEELLLALPPEDDGMLLSEFDGFCAGLIVCPEVILPSEWLPCVWGGDAASGFSSLQEVEYASGLVMAHYNRVVRSLLPPSAGYNAIFDIDPIKGDTLWEPWVAGFEQAMALRRECWVAIVESDDVEAAASVNMMVALHMIDIGESELDEESVDALDLEAPNLIPGLVEALNNWTKSQTAKSPTSSTANLNTRPAGRKKTGRNDPCPCGSGKKYKRCCGAN